MIAAAICAALVGGVAAVAIEWLRARPITRRRERRIAIEWMAELAVASGVDRDRADLWARSVGDPRLDLRLLAEMIRDDARAPAGEAVDVVEVARLLAEMIRGDARAPAGEAVDVVEVAPEDGPAREPAVSQLRHGCGNGE